ncbi:MAG TPA: DUF4870 domain-containing protein [Beutenbergiaceae bacterium]|nr:DUF4870 domain-containing protein [Beutenbergiaceae bacterium]
MSQPPYPESGQPGPQPGQRPDRPGPDPQQPGPPQGPGAGRAQDPNADRDDRTLAILSHLSPLIALVLSAGWLSFVGPLAMWLIFRDRSPLVRNAAATAFNFNITVWIAVIIGWVCLVTIVLIPLAILLWVAAGLLQLIFSIIGAVRASRGEIYRYPMQVPLLR